MKVSGIYALVNKINNKIYIGQSVNIYNRLKEHKHNVKRYKGKNYLLYNAIRKYSWENFHKIVLEYIAFINMPQEDFKKQLVAREDFWIKYFDSLGFKKYNLRPAASSNLGVKVSKETREKLSKALLGNKNSLGVKVSEETKEKHRLYKHKESSKKKISDSLLGNKYSLGNKLSEAHRKKLIEVNTGNKYNLGRKLTEERKLQISKSMVGNKHAIGAKRSEDVIEISRVTASKMERSSNGRFIKKMEI